MNTIIKGRGVSARNKFLLHDPPNTACSLAGEQAVAFATSRCVSSLFWCFLNSSDYG